MINVSTDQTTRGFSCRRGRNPISLSYCEAGQDPEFRGAGKNQTHTRYRVSEPALTSRLIPIASRHAVRVNPQFSNRMIEASRSVLNRYIPDIYLYSDVYKGEESGKYEYFSRVIFTGCLPSPFQISRLCVKSPCGVYNLCIALLRSNFPTRGCPRRISLSKLHGHSLRK